MGKAESALGLHGERGSSPFPGSQPAARMGESEQASWRGLDPDRMTAQPRVSIIIPCYNEEATIEGLLEALRAQTYPLEQLEVVIADGMSEDGTRERIARFAERHPELAVRMVDNPKRIIPAALNRAIEAARGQVVIRMDAHSIPATDYVAKCLEVLEETGAANVGGVWDIQPGAESWIARGIAAAAAHPIGAGGARYRRLRIQRADP